MDSKPVWMSLEHGSPLDTAQSLHCSLSAIAWGELHALTPSKYLQNSDSHLGEWRHHIHPDVPVLHSQKHLVSARIFLLLLVLDKKSPSRIGIGDHA